VALSRTGTLLISAVALCASGCGDSHEAVTRDILTTQKELCAVLDEVKDDASAKAAVPRVKAISDKLKTLQQRSNALGPPPAAIRNALHDKYFKELREATDAIQQNFARLDPLQALQLQNALEEMPSPPGN
jgi:hypothetical protein